ncbi:M23 family metallopeptidase [Cytobacillus sp. S13-E01]|uniref:M23 family metallopeptidase n=1 Tax=Cytobacillus sp. S13-E01 TaxID=3031326 RepID=UPI0023D82E34|nr:M23 family metallopeptidase [Cytobacillus sp. S13-E01]MDF0726772.1 M23 family metallopeptidase [Cytobacillus sp. S13-E01]
MSNRTDDIKKRIAKRKQARQAGGVSGLSKDSSSFIVRDEERYGHERFSSIEGGPNDSGHPLFRKEVFMFKILLSVCLVLIVAILYKNQSPQFDSARQFVKGTMENDFQFAAITKMYEERFGSPLAIFPKDKNDNGEQVAQNEPTTPYAVPVNARVLQGFEVNGQGITVETGSKSAVKAMNEGVITFVGNKDELGKTVIIQHADGSHTWYAKLQSIDVSLYQFVKTGQELGKVMDSEDGQTGTYYFAIKKGETFIDPIQVISFE